MAPPDPCRNFFVAPKSARHRLYEVLRARFVDGESAENIAARFGLSPGTVYAEVRDFKAALDRDNPMPFFVEPVRGPKGAREKCGILEHVLRLRARGYASTDIHAALRKAGIKASPALVECVLREQGLAGMLKRRREDIARVKAEIDSGQVPGLTCPIPAAPSPAAVADARRLDLTGNRELQTRVAGVFLFLPFLLDAGMKDIVDAAKMPGSKMIPPVSNVLSLLALKLLDKERKSHISDWNFDEALGCFAGLNVLPKVTAATDYSYRLVHGESFALLEHWIKAVHPLLCSQSPKAVALDFHPIPHRGENAGVENHYAPMRGKAVPCIQVAFGRAVDAPLLCFAQADLVRSEQHEIPLRFLEYWKNITGTLPEWLYFDSKFTTYPVLRKIHDQGVHFITIRRRGPKLIQKLLKRPDAHWRRATIDTPQRRHQHIRYLDDHVRLGGYGGDCRQVAADLGRSAPALFLTDHDLIPAKEVITRYLDRNTIENELGINVNFFHLDCLSSEVRLHAQTDVVLTVIANGCYRWLSQKLKGCQTMEPKQLYRKFVETGGHITVRQDEFVVSFERRSHNPALAQAQLDNNARPIPWLQNKRLRFEFK